MKNRREFLKTGLAAACVSPVFFVRTAAAAPIADSRIEVLLNEPQGTISPNIYGHFVEHLGGVVYDGLWVGPKSKVPNVNGLRRDVLEHMTKIKVPVVRYPGGCFADSYDWRDGIGPVEKRPRRTNFWNNADSEKSPSNHRFEPNEFGTNEFARFCKLIGAQPYLAANLRSLPATEFQHWVEYCNSPAGSTTYADQRAAAGYAAPFDVLFWGVGNESWGCGGNFTAKEYAVEFRRYTAWLPTYGKPLSLVASGPGGEEWFWTREFLEEIVRKNPGQLREIYGMSLHHYAWNLSRGKTSDWEQGKGDALEFEPIDWYELLREGQRMEVLIEGHWQAMAEFDREHRIKLVVDEWGPWYRSGSEATPGDILEQTPTLRDAVFSGMTMDIFNRHAGRVAMANCAQLINCLNSLYLAHEDRFVVTTVGRVFEMYAGHQGGESLRTEFSAPRVRYDRDGQAATFWGLNGSASIRGRNLFLTVVNPHVGEPREAEIVLRGGRFSSGSVTTIAHADIHAKNTFAHRDAVMPTTVSLSGGDRLVHVFAPASVSAIAIQLR